MTAPSGELLFFELAAMLLVGLVSAAFARQLRLPLVLAEMVGGLVLGPTVFGRVAPSAFARLFPAQGPVALERSSFVQVGLLCFMFVAGLEVNVPGLSKLRSKVAWTSGLGIAIPFALGAALVTTQPDYWGGFIHLTMPQAALLLGTALSISALPVVARILMDLGLMRHEIGSVVVASATIDDIVGWSLFAAIVGSLGADTSSHQAVARVVAVLLLALFCLTIGRRLAGHATPWVRRLLGSPEGVIGATTGLWLIAAGLTEWLGVHGVMGAFFVGLTLAQQGEEPSHSRAVIRKFALGLFAPLYFVSIGLRADFGSNFDLQLVAIVVAIACIGKVAGASAGARLGGMPWRQALAVGFGLNARGAMEIVLATLALDHQLIELRLFVALVTMAVVTSLLSGPVMSRLLESGDVPRSLAAGEVN